MHPMYALADTSNVFSPALLFYRDLIRQNIHNAIRMVGDVSRLRPHAKTHKTREIARMMLDAGITKHKCATVAEAEMLASCGASDVMLAYNPVGPACGRVARLIQKYPKTRFSVTADHPDAARALSETLTAAGQSVDVLLDLDVGMHRTGIPAGEEAAALYELLTKLPGLRTVGFHVYDGHNHQESLADRETAVKRLLQPVLVLRDALQKKGLAVPRIVGGGTPTFPVFARITDVPGLECSPGTFVLHDQGYGTRFPDMTGENGFTPAALLLTRVMSRPTSTRMTLDLGNKAVASDPPAGKRLVLLDVPDAEAVMHNEEHLVIETPAAGRFKPGDVVYAVPAHVCPTCALHRSVYVIEGGRVVGTWEVASRDRMLTV